MKWPHIRENCKRGRTGTKCTGNASKTNKLNVSYKFREIPSYIKPEERSIHMQCRTKLYFLYAKVQLKLRNIIWMRYKIFRPGERHIFIKQPSAVAGSWRWRQTGCCFLSASRRHRDVARSIASFPLRPRALHLSTRSSSGVRAATLSSTPPRFHGARQRNVAGLRDVIQFKNHSLSARTEISSLFFLFEETHRRALLRFGHLASLAL